MKPRKFFWKLFLGNALLLTLALTTSVALIGGQFERFYKEDLIRHLRAQAKVLQHQVQGQFDLSHADELSRLAEAMVADELEGLRVTLVATDGTVIADTEADPAEMEPHNTRPEIREALASGWGQSTRWSRTVKRDMTYVALRVGPPGEPAGVVRVSMGVAALAARSSSVQRLMWGVALVALAAAGLLALGLARLWSDPIGRVTAAARSLSRGDLSARATVRGKDELAQLSQCLNDMRDHLAAQLQTIDRQRRTLESLMAQLHEGVIVSDPNARLVLVNPAATRLLQLVSPHADGRLDGLTVDECIPHAELREMLRPLVVGDGGADSGGPTEVPSGERDVTPRGEVKLQVDTHQGVVSLLARACDIYLPAFATGEGPSSVARPGRLLVLMDVSELARTIQVKADFAANASHELRTPLSSIRAAVETMRSVDLGADPGTAQHFLDMIERNSKRIGTMVRDLLTLSRAESRGEEFDRVPLRIKEVLHEVHASVSDQLSARQLQYSAAIEPGAELLMASPDLLRIVLRNLLDNAIKFTSTEGRINVTVRKSDGCVAITVEDDGCGIPPQEQSRVFERFYQVERARSGPRRGTGLGLSIVRHAVSAMGGTVELQSSPNVGTRVTVRLPWDPGLVDPRSGDLASASSGAAEEQDTSEWD